MARDFLKSKDLEAWQVEIQFRLDLDAYAKAKNKLIKHSYKEVQPY